MRGTCRLRALLAGCGALLAMGLSPAAARADWGEGRVLSLALVPQYGLSYADERAPSGGGGLLQIAYGITDAVGVQLVGGVTVHPLLERPADVAKDLDALPSGLLVSWNAGAGVVYRLDVVRIVPFFEASLGALGMWIRTDGTQPGQVAKTEHTVGAAGAVGLGADYMITRRWAVGVSLRYQVMLSDLQRFPMVLVVGPRAVLRFGL